MELLTNVDDAIEKLKNSLSFSNGIQDVIWYITININKFSNEEVNKLLIALKDYVQFCEPRDALLICNNLKPAYFQIMNEEEKNMYIDMLLQVKEKSNKAFWGDFFELASKIYKDSPENRKDELFNLIFDNIDINLNYPAVICAICFSLRRIFEQLNKERQDKVKDKLIKMKEEIDIEYLKLIISENLNSLI